MKKKNISKRLKKILKLVFKINKNLNEKNLDQNKIKNWDSLNHLNLLSAIQDEFSLKFKDEDLEKITNFKNILKIIKKRN